MTESRLIDGTFYIRIRKGSDLEYDSILRQAARFVMRSVVQNSLKSEISVLGVTTNISNHTLASLIKVSVRLETTIYSAFERSEGFINSVQKEVVEDLCEEYSERIANRFFPGSVGIRNVESDPIGNSWREKEHKLDWRDLEDVSARIAEGVPTDEAKIRADNEQNRKKSMRY